MAAVNLGEMREWLGKTVAWEGRTYVVVDAHVTGDARSDWPRFLLEKRAGIHTDRFWVDGWVLREVGPGA